MYSSLFNDKLIQLQCNTAFDSWVAINDPHGIGIHDSSTDGNYYAMYALEIEQLRKTYAGGFEALKGISLQVEKGDFYALLGPNGAGKSTTIGIISSLVNKTSGTTKVFGLSLIHI